MRPRLGATHPWEVEGEEGDTIGPPILVGDEANHVVDICLNGARNCSNVRKTCIFACVRIPSKEGRHRLHRKQRGTGAVEYAQAVHRFVDDAVGRWHDGVRPKSARHAENFARREGDVGAEGFQSSGAD